jgi:hypothetical protein
VDEIIKKAFDIANYMSTLAAQKQILKEEFNQSLIHFHNGGTFTITKELIVFIKTIKEITNNNTTVIVDDNQIPVEILDVDAFLECILSKYQFAINGYYTKYAAIKNARTVESILGK